MDIPISVLEGDFIVQINVGDARIEFVTLVGGRYVMQHHQDCCEQVYVEDIVGDINDLIGASVVHASEETSGDTPADLALSHPIEGVESQTWTFYKIGTTKGSVTIRWHGTSSGYYSESVYFERK